MSVDFDALRCPTKIVASDPTSPIPDAPPFDFDNAAVDHEYLPGTTHFLQLEKPEECAASMLRFLEQLGILKGQPLSQGSTA